MSGVEVPREQKQLHACASCMNTVVQSFCHFQEQIRTLRKEKANLQEKIKVLEEENAELKKKSASRKSQ
jgi:predicted nuclease with TOPRIM domain